MLGALPVEQQYGLLDNMDTHGLVHIDVPSFVSDSGSTLSLGSGNGLSCPTSDTRSSGIDVGSEILRVMFWYQIVGEWHIQNIKSNTPEMSTPFKIMTIDDILDHGEPQENDLELKVC